MERKRWNCLLDQKWKQQGEESCKAAKDLKTLMSPVDAVDT